MFLRVIRRPSRVLIISKMSVCVLISGGTRNEATLTPGTQMTPAKQHQGKKGLLSACYSRLPKTVTDWTITVKTRRSWLSANRAVWTLNSLVYLSIVQRLIISSIAEKEGKGIIYRWTTKKSLEFDTHALEHLHLAGAKGICG